MDRRLQREFDRILEMIGATPEARLVYVLALIAAILVSQAIQAADDLLSKLGAISLAHGVLVGYVEIYACKRLLEWTGLSLDWLVVLLVALSALAVSLIKIHRTGTRWILAFNFGVLAGVIAGGFLLV